MGIKRTTYPHTGIFQRKATQVDLRADAESFHHLAAVLQSASFKGELDRIESVARSFLDDYLKTDIMNGLCKDKRQEIGRVMRSAGIEWVVMQHVERERERLNYELGKKPSKEKERKLTRALSRVERAADANDILCAIPGVRSYLEAGPPGQISAETIVSVGFAVGDAYGRFRAREFERAAYTGAPVLKGASGGGSNEKKKKEATERYMEIAFNFQKLGLSRAVFSRVQKVKPRTLRRALERAKKVGPPPPK